MKWLRIGAAAAILAVASYAEAAPPEGLLGKPLPAASGTKPSPARAAPAVAAGAAAADSDGALGRASRVLDRLRPEGRAATRGANETRVYQAASPAVVLVATKESLGSGVLIGADGQIVTNHHVVGDAKEVAVIFKPRVEGASVQDAAVHRAKVLRIDEVADLALIQVAEVPSHVKPLTLGTNASVAVGADVHAIGHPTGESWTYTKGIVSQIRRDYEWAAEDRVKRKATVIQTQTPINPGNSGGPLIDDQLQVVGINSFVSDGEGLNFAVSADDVRAFLARSGDRLAERPARIAAKDCKLTAIDERPSKDPKGTEFLLDADCDGKGDMISIVPDDKREPIAILADDDGDGKLDTAYLDNNRDGAPDVALYDTDGDGKYDLEGKFRKGEAEPYRWEKIKG